jgi:hypothetical protein
MATNDEDIRGMEEKEIEEVEQTEEELMMELENSIKSDNTGIKEGILSQDSSKKDINFFHSYKEKNKEFQEILISSLYFYMY